MRKLILLITLAFLGLISVNAQQIDMGNSLNSSRCGASPLDAGFGSTGSSFIIQTDKDFDKMRFWHAANSIGKSNPPLWRSLNKESKTINLTGQTRSAFFNSVGKIKTII